jgi:hypothetical protein
MQSQTQMTLFFVPDAVGKQTQVPVAPLQIYDRGSAFANLLVNVCVAPRESVDSCQRDVCPWARQRPTLKPKPSENIHWGSSPAAMKSHWSWRDCNGTLVAANWLKPHGQT